MLGATHACANPLTARYGTDPRRRHCADAAARGAVECGGRLGERYAELLAGSDGISAGSPADALANRLEALAKTGGLTTRLSDAAVEEASLPALASLAASQWTGSFNPRPFDAEGALEIYRAAF